MIITKSVSRFGRNTVDCLNSIRELKTLGVDVYFEKENIHTNRSEGELLITLISAVAQNEIVTQSENIKWGKHRKYEKGDINSIPWKNIMGYGEDENGEPIIVEKEAAVIRRVYQEFLNGYGLRRIARRLNEDNIPMANGGKKWTGTFISSLLHNEKYKGDIRFQKYLNRDPLSKKQVKNKGDLPQYYCETTHPAIVERSIWECVELEIARQKRYRDEHFMLQYSYKGKKEAFPLTGKITCAQCGHLLKIRESARLVDRGEKYYICPKFAAGYRRKSKPGACCNGSWISPDTPKNAFIKAWNRLVDEQESYRQEWQQTINGNDVLKAYRAKELMRLVAETGRIDKMPYELMLKTLDHIEIGIDGKVEVVFLAGTRVEG